MPSTIFRLRSRTAGISTFQSPGGDPELGAPAEIVGDLGAVDHVLAREARDVRAGARDIPPLDDRRPLPLRGQRPGEEPAPPAAEHHQVVNPGDETCGTY